MTYLPYLPLIPLVWLIVGILLLIKLPPREAFWFAGFITLALWGVLLLVIN